MNKENEQPQAVKAEKKLSAAQDFKNSLGSYMDNAYSIGIRTGITAAQALIQSVAVAESQRGRSTMVFRNLIQQSEKLSRDLMNKEKDSDEMRDMVRSAVADLGKDAKPSKRAVAKS